MTSKDSVYSVPVGNFCRFVMTLSLIVIKADGSRSLMAMKICRCFTRRLMEFSDSKLPSSTVMGVVYRLLVNLISAAFAMSRS